jgi:hypothetical protein
MNADTWPLVSFQIAGDNRWEDVEPRVLEVQELYRRPEKLISLSDARLAINGAAHRQIWKDWSVRLGPAVNDRTMAAVVILSSSLERGALTAINWFTKPGYPQSVAATPDEALAWVEREAARLRLALPSAYKARTVAWLEEGVAQYRASGARV